MAAPGEGRLYACFYAGGDFQLATGDCHFWPPPTTFIRPPVYTFARPGTSRSALGADLLVKTRGAGPYAAGATDVTRGAVTPISERAANQILGTAIFAMGLGLAAAGTIVGAGASNPQERATALDKGEQFDGIKLGNVFVPGHMLGRLWYPPAAAANVYEAQEYVKQGATPEEMMVDGIQRIGTFFGNETFMRQFRRRHGRS